MVQMPISLIERELLKLEKYEQALKLREDLKEAFLEVEKMRELKGKKKTLSSFIHELSFTKYLLALLNMGCFFIYFLH